MWLPEVTGPDGIAVTVRVEPAVEKWARTWFRWAVPPLLLIAVPRAMRAVLGTAQKDILGDRWAVDLESDGGVKLRLTAPTEDEATALGQRISAAIAERGEAAIEEFRA
jgi:hypothetical protein